MQPPQREILKGQISLNEGLSGAKLGRIWGGVYGWGQH